MPFPFSPDLPASAAWQSPKDLPWPQMSFLFSPDELDDRLPEVLRHLQQHYQQLLALKLKGGNAAGLLWYQALLCRPSLGSAPHAL